MCLHQAPCTAEPVNVGIALVADWNKSTLGHLVWCAESTDITTSIAVRASLGETRRDEDGVTLEENWSMYRWASLVCGVSIATTRYFSDTECLEEDLKVWTLWISKECLLLIDITVLLYIFFVIFFWLLLSLRYSLASYRRSAGSGRIRPQWSTLGY